MTVASLEPVFLKLTRASQHLDALEQAIKDLIGDDANNVDGLGSVYAEFNGPEGWFTVTARPPSEVPLEIALPLGDCLQNMRSALDHLVCQLTIANNKGPNRATAFPVWHDEPEPDERKKFLSPIQKIDLRAQALIEDMQPFQNGKGELADTYLWVLHELNNADKHRLLHPTEFWIVTNGCQVLLPDGSKIEPLEFIDRGPLKQDAVIARFEWEPLAAEDGEMDMQIDATFDVAFAEPPKVGPELVNCAGAPISYLLREIQAMVRDEIVPSFAEFF